jgi:hypothetical protein
MTSCSQPKRQFNTINNTWEVVRGEHEWTRYITLGGEMMYLFCHNCKGTLLHGYGKIGHVDGTLEPV